MRLARAFGVQAKRVVAEPVDTGDHGPDPGPHGSEHHDRLRVALHVGPGVVLEVEGAMAAVRGEHRGGGRQAQGVVDPRVPEDRVMEELVLRVDQAGVDERQDHHRRHPSHGPFERDEAEAGGEPDHGDGHPPQPVERVRGRRDLGSEALPEHDGIEVDRDGSGPGNHRGARNAALHGRDDTPGGPVHVLGTAAP